MVTSLRQLLTLLGLVAAAAPLTAPGPRAERILAEAGFWGSRLVVERLTADSLPYADNFVDLIVVDEPRGIPATEVFRVVRPRGCALVKGDTQLVADLGRTGLEIEALADGWTLARKRARRSRICTSSRDPARA